ncbi:hypothetical protein C8J56DRAFT_1016025 [Mycena floridula]|nr:hypothetical protein C8J56DRAFT_1016025 [Mycena floridula]
MSTQSLYSSECSKETGSLLHIPATGSYRVKYAAHSDWDFHLDLARGPVDLSLILPHYRARNQPVHHRLNMFVGHDSGPVKLKVCRPSPRSKFYLEVQADTSNVTIWVPSDFKGQIHHSGRATFSAGFVNRILQNVKLNEPSTYEDPVHEDDITIVTSGQINLRMWDVQTCAPENTHMENIKRMLGCAKKSPEASVNWDFLLED